MRLTLPSTVPELWERVSPLPDCLVVAPQSGNDAVHEPDGGNPNGSGCACCPIAGQLATTARHRTLHLSTHTPCTQLTLHALTALRALTGRPAPNG